MVLANLPQKSIEVKDFFFPDSRKRSEIFSIFLLFSITEYADHEDQIV